jgi:hypothetical protein
LSNQSSSHVRAALIDDIEELAERGIAVPYETVLRWMN